MIAHYYLLPRYDLTPTLFILIHDSFYYLIILVFIDFLVNCHVCLTLFSRDFVFRNLEGCFRYFYHTFPMSNLTPGPDLVFHRPAFLNKESHLGFSFLFCFSLKNKTKISDDSKSFLKIIFFTK